MAAKQISWDEENMACVATYRILEGDKFMDQFEDSEVGFADAAELTMGELRYFPKTTKNSAIIKGVAFDRARQFFTLLLKTFTVKKETLGDSTEAVIVSLATVFQDRKKTLLDLAQLVDDRVKFPGE
jgi:hypothetical protein